MRRLMVLAGALLLLSLLAPWRAAAQSSDAPDGADTPIAAAENGKGYKLRVTTREVVVEVVARDRENHPINDLQATDFSIEEGAHRGKAAVKISGFRVIDPDSAEGAMKMRAGAVVLPLGGRCEIRSTVHYELAFHPANWTSGIHVVHVSASRAHVVLSYRSQFYVGVADVEQLAAPEASSKIDPELQQAACYHSVVPPSIPLGLMRVANAEQDPFRYQIRIDPESLAYAGITETTTQVQLEYGICTFDRAGRSISFWRSSVNRAITSSDLTTILEGGWEERIEIPHKGNPALTRLVVLEPRSGNVGSVDVAIEAHGQPKHRSSANAGARRALAIKPDVEDRRVGSTSSLGSAISSPEAMCGDVYELPKSTTFLPSDFRALNAVGSVYTDAFAVPEQVLRLGLPGSTPRSEWFGVDYYGEFWVTKPGRYDFELTADDGADLFIDGRKVISDDGIHPPQTMTGSVNLDVGRHAIHLPYFEGPTYVSLGLRVKPPDGILDTFDVRDYPKPAAETEDNAP